MVAIENVVVGWVGGGRTDDGHSATITDNVLFFPKSYTHNTQQPTYTTTHQHTQHTTHHDKTQINTTTTTTTTTT